MDDREAAFEVAELEALYNESPPVWPWTRWETACELIQREYDANPWWRFLRARRLLREWQTVLDDWGREIYDEFHE